jgi:ABC-2 type transport system permease protein
MNARVANLHIIWMIARKDLVDAVKNQLLFLSLLMPIFLWLLFRLVFSGMGDMGTMKITVHDEANSRLVNALRTMPGVTISELETEQQVIDLVKKQAYSGLVIPAGFDEAVTAGQNPPLTVYINSRSGGGGIQAFQTMIDQQLWKLAGHDSLPAQIKIVDTAGEKPGLFSSGIDMGHVMAVTMLVLSIVGVGVFVVPSLLVEEKEKQTLKFLLVSPAGPVEVVAGKALVGLAACLVIVGLMMILNKGWSGNWPVTLLALILGSLFSILLGLAMGGFFKTIAQVNTWSSVLLIVLLLPTWVAVMPLPDPFGLLVRLVPSYYLVDLLNQSMSGNATFSSVWSSLTVLAVCTVVAFSMVVWTVKREDRM